MIYLRQSIKANFIIRVAQQLDILELRDLYKNTVLVVNRRDYSQEEVEDWASIEAVEQKYKANRLSLTNFWDGKGIGLNTF